MFERNATGVGTSIPWSHPVIHFFSGEEKKKAKRNTTPKFFPIGDYPGRGKGEFERKGSGSGSYESPLGKLGPRGKQEETLS